MKHLNLGAYSYIVDVDALLIESGTTKHFTREELPEDLKSLFNVLSKDVNQKAFFIVVKSEQYSNGSGFAFNDGGDISLKTSYFELKLALIEEDNVDKVSIFYSEL